MKHLGDIAKINGTDAPPVKVIIGGSPCQDLSIAGRREGLKGERSGLFTEQIRIIKEMRTEDIKRGRKSTDIRPRYMVWENVPGAFSSNRGQDFKAVLEETISIVEEVKPDIPVPKGGWHYSGIIMGDGFSVAWRVFDAQFWGVPQRRRRIALIADFGGESAPEILFERKGVSRHTPPRATPWKDFAAALAERLGGANKSERPWVYDARGNGDGETAPTITGGHENRVTDYTGLCVRERCGCEGGGKGVLIQDNKSGTLAANNDQFVIAIDRAAFNQGKNAQYDFEISDSGINSTLTAKGASAVFSFDSLSSNSMKSSNPNSGCRQVDIAKTIDTSTPDPSKNQGGNAIVNNSTVRRLTPLECERLQGFPDGWTDTGDYINSKGKKCKTSDTARYKALGNSIALPSWVWVLERLSYCCGADRTMASLFDGIGGFPLIWETLNGDGACLWASEIEEFPIAVTKYHFKED